MRNSEAGFIPQFPIELPGSFWGVTAYFNPAGYKNKRENYRVFRERSLKQGLKLLAVELVFGEAPFELSAADAEILIQIRGADKNVMWQKEALLNIGLKNLPADCDKAAILDCDICFKNDSWIKETSVLLEKYFIVQPFSSLVRLPKGIHEGDASLYNGSDGFAFQRAMASVLEGHPGFCWAFRKDMILKHLLCDRMVSGGADHVMAYYFCGEFKHPWIVTNLNAKMLAYSLQWGQSIFKEVQGSVWFVPGEMLHLWHGTVADRVYFYRLMMLDALGFIPEVDVRAAENGILEWATEKPKLHREVKKYFWFRNEEGKSLLNVLFGGKHNAITSRIAYKAEVILHSLYKWVFFSSCLRKSALFTARKIFFFNKIAMRRL